MLRIFKDGLYNNHFDKKHPKLIQIYSYLLKRTLNREQCV